jgi:hypothetical protein
MPEGGSRTPRDGNEQAVTGQTDHIEIDWPRSIGFFGGLGVAAALELVPLPIAVFVAGVPFLKLLNRPNASTPQTFFGHLVDGAAKPVGGDSEGTVRWAPKAMRAQRNDAQRNGTSGRNRSRSRGQTRGKGTQ